VVSLEGSICCWRIRQVLAQQMLCKNCSQIRVPQRDPVKHQNPCHMNNSISKAAYAGLGHCSVCGLWTKLEMWDEGLNGRFCSECFDHVVDAEELLTSQGLLVPGPETKQQARNT
jgi:hypothetical protein